MGDSINLTQGWNTLWGALNIPPAVMILLSVIGVIMVIGAIFKWILDRKRQGSQGMGQSSGPLLWATLAGVAIAAPALIIPIALTILDWIIKAFVSIWQGTGGTA